MTTEPLYEMVILWRVLSNNTLSSRGMQLHMSTRRVQILPQVLSLNEKLQKAEGLEGEALTR